MYYSNACGMKWFGKIEFFFKDNFIITGAFGQSAVNQCFLIVGLVDVYIALTYVCF